MRKQNEVMGAKVLEGTVTDSDRMCLLYDLENIMMAYKYLYLSMMSSFVVAELCYLSMILTYEDDKHLDADKIILAAL